MADNRIAYGLAKQHGIDTTGMNPKQVWDALSKKGITRESAERERAESDNKKLDKLVNKFSDTPAEDKAAMGLGVQAEGKGKTLSSTDNVTFHRKMEKAKANIDEASRWRVDVHNVEDYKNDKLFISKGGSCVAIEPNGNIISVCKHTEDETIRGKDLIKHAVENGGDRLDAFGKGLYLFYTKQGFEPISWTPFNEEYAPEGWDKNRDEPEPVIFYKYTGKVTGETYEEFTKRVKSSKDYDEAMSLRDKEI